MSLSRSCTCNHRFYVNNMKTGSGSDVTRPKIASQQIIMSLLCILGSRMVVAFPPPSVFARQLAGVRPVSLQRIIAHRITLQARSNIHRSLTTQAASVTRSTPPKSGLPFIFTAAGVASVGLGLSLFTRHQIHCDCT